MLTSKNAKTAITPDKESYNQYLFFWIGQLVSLLGSSIVQFSIIYWITVVTKSPVYLGIASFLGLGTTLVVGPFAGVFVDRWDRKKIIGILDFFQVLVTLILAVLFLTDLIQIYHIFAVLALRGIFQGFHQTSMESIIPLMVPKDKLSRFNSMKYLGSGVINLIGPLVGALLIGLVGIHQLESILVIDGITFLIALVPLLIIQIPDIRTEEEKANPTDFSEDLSEGIGFILNKNGLLSLIVVFTIANFLFAPLFVLLPLIVIDPQIIGGNQNILAYTLAIQQGGTILGSLILSSKEIFSSHVKAVFMGLLLGSVAIITVGVSALLGNILVLFAGVSMFGIILPVANVQFFTILQKVVPADLQGRVLSVSKTVAQASGPISMAITGIIAELIGSVILLIVAGSVEIGLVLLFWFSTNLPNVEEQMKEENNT